MGEMLEIHEDKRYRGFIIFPLPSILEDGTQWVYVYMDNPLIYGDGFKTLAEAEAAIDKQVKDIVRKSLEKNPIRVSESAKAIV